MKLKILGILVLIAGLIQLVPYGKDYTNPPVVAEPAWDSPQTRALFFHACADCHSNETRWPKYSHIAPISWLIRSDVDEGREHFNVSTWGQGRHNKANEAAQAVREGEMPPLPYQLMHSEARLTDVEKQSLIRGLAATFGDKHRDAATTD